MATDTETVSLSPSDIFVGDDVDAKHRNVSIDRIDERCACRFPQPGPYVVSPDLSSICSRRRRNWLDRERNILVYRGHNSQIRRGTDAVSRA